MNLASPPDSEARVEAARLRTDRNLYIGRLATVTHPGHRWKLEQQIAACDTHIGRLERLR